MLIKPGRLLPLGSWETMADVGVRAGDHLELRFLRVGGDPGSPSTSTDTGSKSKVCDEATRSLHRRKGRDNDTDDDSDLTGTAAGGDTSKTRPKKRQRQAAPSIVIHEDSGSESEGDGEFVDDESGESDDDGDIEMLDNEELAEILPTKAPSIKGKRKAAIDAGAKNTKKKRRNKSKVSASTPAPAPAPTGGGSAAVGAAESGGARGRRHPIYLFFEQVEHNAYGQPGSEGSTHWRFCHGKRKIHTITKTMKGNNSGLVTQLKSEPSLFMLTALRTKASLQERGLASGKIPMTEELAAHYGAKLDQRQESIKKAFERQQASRQEPWDDKVFEDLMTRWIVACDQPFDEIEKPAFIALMSYAQNHTPPPSYSMPGRFTIKRRAMEMGSDTESEIRDMFKALESKIAISLDAWTSSNGYAFLAIVAHYVTNEGAQEELLIDFHELIGAHTGENMAHAVWETLERYGLKGRISAFVMDNASNNDTLVETVEALCTAEGITFSATQARLRCMPHTIHLSAIKLLEAIGAITRSEADKATSRAINYQDSVTSPLDPKPSISRGKKSSELKTAGDQEEEEEEEEEEMTSDAAEGSQVEQDVSTAVGKLRAIVRAIRSSPQRRQAWPAEVKFVRATAPSDDIRILMLILDVKTRWSSTHQMLRRALRYKTAINSYVHRFNRELGHLQLTETDWKAIELVTGWLKAFREATTDMSTTSRPMLSSVHCTFRALQLHLKDALRALPTSAPSRLRNGLVEAHSKLAEYYTKVDESYLYTWAGLLDPRISYEGLKLDYQDDPNLMDYLDDAKAKLREHYESEYASKAPSTTTQTPQAFASGASSSVLSSAQAVPNGSPRKLKIGDRYRRQPTAVSNELEEFYKMPPEDFVTCDPIQWWHAHRSRFPRLYRLACDVLSIPGSAVAVERVFSGGRDTISLRRASLAPATIRVLMLVKHKLRLERKALEVADGKYIV